MLRQSLFLLLCLPFTVMADGNLDKVSVIAINAFDRNAVVKQPGQAMQVLKVGDKLTEQAKLVDVLTDKVVFEEIVMHDKQKVKETVWLYKAINGKSRLQRLSKQAPASPMLTTSGHGKADKKTTSDLDAIERKLRKEGKTGGRKLLKDK